MAIELPLVMAVDFGARRGHSRPLARAADGKEGDFSLEQANLGRNDWERAAPGEGVCGVTRPLIAGRLTDHPPRVLKRHLMVLPPLLRLTSPASFFTRP